MAEHGPELLVLGARTCEDTAIARSRLEALGVPYGYVDIDLDPSGLERVLALEGRRVTPTILREGEGLGGDAAGTGHVVEPSVERLDAFLASAGFVFERPRATAIHGSRAARAIPFRTLESPDGTPFSLERIRGRRGAALFLAHRSHCLACRGYARLLAATASPLADVDAVPVVAVPGDPAAVESWLDGMAPGGRVLVDPGGGWGAAIRTALGLPADQPALVLLDRFEAPRAISSAPEAGGLISPSEAVDWLGFVALDCPECGEEVAWPD